MPTLNIDGNRVTVDDSFLKLSPEQQSATVDEIAASFKPKLDKYQQAAVEEDKAIGGADAGFTRRLAHGATLGADTTILAGLETPLEMMKRGTLDPREGYNYAKAREDFIMNKSRENTGLLGTAAEALGGGVSAGGLAKAGVTAARYLPQEANLFQRSLAGAADAAGIGGISGAMEGNGIAERGLNAAKGFAVGGIIGGATGPVLELAKVLATPITSLVKAKLNPQAYAEAQVARAIQEGKLTPDEVSLAMIQAKNEGQGVFTLADALGNPGQRMLSTVTRAPGEGRTQVVEALNARQADQGRRVSSALSEGFDAPQTAAQTEARMTKVRDTAADAEYGQVRTDAMPVDPSRAVSKIDETLAPYGVAHDAANDSAAGVLARYRKLIDGNNDFNHLQRVRGDLFDDMKQAYQSGAGNKGRLLRGVLKEVDEALEASSAGYKQANKNFAQASRDIEAVQSGRDAAMRGRTEDTIPAFQRLGPEGQQAYRAGYADPLIAQTQGGAFGANKARPLTSDAFREEAAAMAPGNDMMQRRLARENTMFETRNAAMGGSKTADNLADQAAMGVSPEVVGVLKNIVTGNFGGAVKGAIAAGSNAMTGNTAAVRKAVAEMLLETGQKIPPARLQNMVDAVLKRAIRATQIADSIGRGVAGGAAVTGPGQRR